VSGVVSANAGDADGTGADAIGVAGADADELTFPSAGLLQPPRIDARPTTMITAEIVVATRRKTRINPLQA
jgi:hypothetical protein